MNIHSDPVVQSHEPVVLCKLCGEHGHSKRSCTYTKAMDPANMSHEDSVFWSYVHPANRPESLCLGAGDDELGGDDDEDDRGGVQASDTEDSVDDSSVEEDESDDSHESNDSDSSDLMNLYM